MKQLVFLALILLFFLNLVDAFATYHWVVNGIAAEQNPIMNFVFNLSPTLFLFLKIVVGSLCTWVLLTRKKRPAIRALIFPVLGIYLYATFLHCEIALKVF